MITVIGLTMTLVVAVTSRVDRDSGLAPIALGIGLCTLGYFLYGMRPVLTGLLFSALSNLALSGSISCFIYGILRFQRRAQHGCKQAHKPRRLRDHLLIRGRAHDQAAAGSKAHQFHLGI